MRFAPLALASLALLNLAADTQKKVAAPATKEPRDSKQKDIVRLLGALGMPQANSEAARKQITAASKEARLASYPAAYWKEYLDAAAPETFEKILVPIFDKAYSHDEIRTFLKLYSSPEFKQLLEKQPEGTRLLTEKNPANLRGKAFEAFSAHMTEVGRTLQAKHGIKAVEPKK